MGKKYEHSHLVHNAKTSAGKRKIAERLPQIIEPPKSFLALRGHSTSAVGTALLNDLHLLKKPYSRKLNRKNNVLPFESGGEAHLENLCRLNDTSLFALVNHTKKRPDNLILGRMFAFNILDMFEFAVSAYMPIAGFSNSGNWAPGSAPLLVFNGADYNATEQTRVLRSLMLDMFRAPSDIQAVNLAGIDRVIVFTLHDDNKILFRHYRVALKRTKGSNLPTAGLQEIGPRFNLEMRRSQLAPEALRKLAMRKPRDPKWVPKKKNVSRDELGDKVGRVHVGRQDLSGLALARMKGLGKKRGAHDVGAGNGEGNELESTGDGDPGADGTAEQDEKAPVERPAKKVRFEGLST